MGPVVPHFAEHHVTAARPEHRQRPSLVARKYTTRVQSMMQEPTGAIRSLANGKAVGPDRVSAELFKITLNGDSALCQRLLDIVVCIWRWGEALQQWKDAIVMVLHKKKDRTKRVVATGSSRW